MNTLLKQSLLSRNWKDFFQVRFSIAGEGEIFTIANLDLQNCDLRELPAKFICFKNCNLNGANFAGNDFFPCAFWNCDLKDVDFRGTTGMLFALDCDFRGAKYNEATLFNDVARTDSPSALQSCKLDSEFKMFLKKQGVNFRLTSALMHYAFEEAPVNRY